MAAKRDFEHLRLQIPADPLVGQELIKHNSEYLSADGSMAGKYSTDEIKALAGYVVEVQGKDGEPARLGVRRADYDQALLSAYGAPTASTARPSSSASTGRSLSGRIKSNPHTGSVALNGGYLSQAGIPPCSYLKVEVVPATEPGGMGQIVLLYDKPAPEGETRGRTPKATAENSGASEGSEGSASSSSEDSASSPRSSNSSNARTAKPPTGGRVRSLVAKAS